MYDICDSRDVTGDFGYIATPGYPSTVPRGRNCTKTITVPSGKFGYFRIISSDMPNGDTCVAWDHLKLASGKREELFCGVVVHGGFTNNYMWSFPAGRVDLTFFSHPTMKHYEGFVLYFEGICLFHCI